MPKPPILPPNNPKRPDWELLGKIMDLKPSDFTIPEDEDEAAKMLKGMLRTAWKMDPRQTMIRLAGQTIRSKIAQFQLTGQNKEDFVDELSSRLENRRGTEITEKNRTNNAIETWDPKIGGVVSYMRGRVGFAVGDMLRDDSPILSSGGIKRDNIKDQPVSVSSLNYILESGREISESGRFVQSSHTLDDPDATEPMTPEEMRQQAKLDLDATKSKQRYEERIVQDTAKFMSEVQRELLQRSQQSEEEELEIESETEENLAELDAGDFRNELANEFEKIELTRKEIHEQGIQISRENPNRPDVCWFINELGFENELAELHPDTRMQQMKAVVQEGVRELLGQHEDYPIFAEILEGWDPAKDLLTSPQYSDILDAALYESALRERQPHEKEEVNQDTPVDEDKDQLFLPGLDSSSPVEDDLTIRKAEAMIAQSALAMSLRKAMLDGQKQSFDPDDPKRIDLVFLKENVPHRTNEIKDLSVRDATAKLAEGFVNVADSKLYEFSPEAKGALKKVISEFNPARSFIDHTVKGLRNLAEQGLLNGPEWSAPEHNIRSGIIYGEDAKQTKREVEGYKKALEEENTKKQVELGVGASSDTDWIKNAFPSDPKPSGGGKPSDPNMSGGGNPPAGKPTEDENLDMDIL